MVGDAAPEESIGCLVGLTIMCFLFAVMMPTMMFMYIDMHTMRKENLLLKSKIGKFSSLIERCDR